MRSRRRKQFKRLYDKLPLRIQSLAEEKFQLFLSNPNHPSFQVKVVQATAHQPMPDWEYRIDNNYRATCFHDGDTYVWVFIGSHDDFERFYS